MSAPEDGNLRVYTIGHSNVTFADLLAKLQKFNIEVVVDVRSAPYSKFNPQFNHENLKLSVKDTGTLKYLYLGRELGGVPKDESFYDEFGHTLYWKIAETEGFKSGIQRLLNGISQYRVALMCGEENPTSCHRRLLLSRVLRENGVEVLHIRGNGFAQTEEELDEENGVANKQMSLFGQREEPEWKSPNPVIDR
jgi:uncharacterized protein (DUF488 family)